MVGDVSSYVVLIVFQETRKRAKVDDECADNCLKRMTDALQKAVQEEGTDSINSGVSWRTV